jgi:serine/threonine protein kinase
MPATPVPTPFMPRTALMAIPPPNSNISHTRRGSPGYVAPELVFESIQSKKGDIWSLGCVLYELACGNMAFPPPPQQPPAQLSQDPLWHYVKGNGKPPEVSPTDNPKIYNPAAGLNCFGDPVSGRYRINQVIQWCLERDPNDRPKIWRLICHVKSIVMQPA